MSRFEIAEAAVAVPRDGRKALARELAYHYDSDPASPLGPLWLTLTALMVRTCSVDDADLLAGDAALVVRGLREVPPATRPAVAFALLDVVSLPSARPLFAALSHQLAQWGW